MHHDLGAQLVRDPVGRLPELGGRVVVDEPVLGARRHVVDDLADELAVARAVRVVVAAGQPVRLVEAEPVLTVERRQLDARQLVEPRGRSERLVEHHDAHAGAVVARVFERVGSRQGDALTRHGHRRRACHKLARGLRAASCRRRR